MLREAAEQLVLERAGGKHNNCKLSVHRSMVQSASGRDTSTRDQPVVRLHATGDQSTAGLNTISQGGAQEVAQWVACLQNGQPACDECKL